MLVKCQYKPADQAQSNPYPVCCIQIMNTTPAKSRSSKLSSRLAASGSVSQRTLAYQGFRQQIIDARILPGQFVSQRELMEMLEMPLAAVRELIPRLEAAGLIKTVPQRGLQIATVDMKLIRNAWQVRTMIEREAVINFCRVVSPQVISELIERHESILQRALSSVPDDALERDAQSVDWGLHDQMVDAIGNEILSEIYRVNSLHVRLIRYDAQSMGPMQVVPAMEEHLGFLRALNSGDHEQALSNMMKHIEQSKHRVLDGMFGSGHHTG